MDGDIRRTVVYANVLDLSVLNLLVHFCCDCNPLHMPCNYVISIAAGKIGCRARQAKQDGQAQSAELPEGMWQASGIGLQCALLS